MIGLKTIFVVVVVVVFIIVVIIIIIIIIIVINIVSRHHFRRFNARVLTNWHFVISLQLAFRIAPTLRLRDTFTFDSEHAKKGKNYFMDLHGSKLNARCVWSMTDQISHHLYWIEAHLQTSRFPSNALPWISDGVFSNLVLILMPLWHAEACGKYEIDCPQ